MNFLFKLEFFPKNSTVFDQFVTDCMNDYDQFSKKKAEEDEKN